MGGQPHNGGMVSAMGTMPYMGVGGAVGGSGGRPMTMGAPGPTHTNTNNAR